MTAPLRASLFPSPVAGCIDVGVELLPVAMPLWMTCLAPEVACPAGDDVVAVAAWAPATDEVEDGYLSYGTQHLHAIESVLACTYAEAALQYDCSVDEAPTARGSDGQLL